MAALVTWEYYSSLYNTVTEEEFAAAEKKAEKDVARVTGPIHWAEIPQDIAGEIYEDQLKDCICKVINYKAQAPAAQGRGVSSVSNDGYSESYVLQTQSQADEELSMNIRTWLSGTGLVRAY